MIHILACCICFGCLGLCGVEPRTWNCQNLNSLNAANLRLPVKACPGCQQTPNFHKLSAISLLAAIMSIGYSTIAIGVSAHAGKQPGTEYNLDGFTRDKGIFGIMNSLGTIAFAYGGHNVVMEIQATIPSRPTEQKPNPTLRPMMVSLLNLYAWAVQSTTEPCSVLQKGFSMCTVHRKGRNLCSISQSGPYDDGLSELSVLQGAHCKQQMVLCCASPACASWQAVPLRFAILSTLSFFLPCCYCHVIACLLLPYLILSMQSQHDSLAAFWMAMLLGPELALTKSDLRLHHENEHMAS